MNNLKLNDIWWSTKIYSSLPVLKQPLRDNANPAPNIRTNSCKESSGILVGNVANYYFHLKSTNVYVLNMLYQVINYQYVSVTFAITIGVGLQEYKEYNNLPHGISGTTQCYNKCLKHSVFQPTHFLLFF